MKKERDDSHFWRVDRACADAMVKVACAHADSGAKTMVFTGRKLTPEHEKALASVGAMVVSTRGER